MASSEKPHKQLRFTDTVLQGGACDLGDVDRYDNRREQADPIERPLHQGASGYLTVRRHRLGLRGPRP